MILKLCLSIYLNHFLSQDVCQPIHLCHKYVVLMLNFMFTCKKIQQVLNIRYLIKYVLCFIFYVLCFIFLSVLWILNWDFIVYKALFHLSVTNYIHFMLLSCSEWLKIEHKTFLKDPWNWNHKLTITAEKIIHPRTKH